MLASLFMASGRGTEQHGLCGQSGSERHRAAGATAAPERSSFSITNMTVADDMLP